MNISVKNHSSEFSQSFLDLYIFSFPDNERREWNSTIDVDSFCRLNQRYFYIMDIFVDDNFAGFVSYWDFDDFIYVEHIAISHLSRNKGIGSSILKFLISKINDNIILEVEPPIDDISIKRIKFYNRIGFSVVNNINYIQPAYSDKRQPIALLIMTHGNIQISDISDHKLRLIKRFVYNIPD